MSKIIYLMRHGIPDFFTERLTEEGRTQVLQSAALLRAELSDFVERNPAEEITIYHSLRLRASDTAVVLADGLKPLRTNLIKEARLNCDSYYIREVVEQASSPAILISHEHDLDEFTYSLRLPWRFSYGQFHRLEF